MTDSEKVVTDPTHEIKTTSSGENDGLSPEVSFGLGDAPMIEKKDLSFWVLLALAFNICNCWASVAGTFSLSMVANGPPSLLYGMILTSVGYLCIALTLAELVSVYPTAGGQYHFTSILAPKSINKFTSYLCGIIAVFSWIAIGASVAQFPALQIMAMALNYNPDLVAHAWHYFLIYQAANIAVTLNNVFLLKRTSWTHTIGFCLTIILFAISIITTLGRSVSKQNHDFVWITFINLTGWDQGFAFLYALLVPCFMYCGLDGALHVAEECPNPKKTVPKVLLMTVGIGFVTAFTFSIVMSYCIANFALVYFTRTGFPIYELYILAFRSDTGATVLMVASLIMVWFTLNAIYETSSRLIWSFARDNGFLFSRYIGEVNQKLDVPVWAILLNGFVVLVAGCIYVASTTAFNALIGSAVVLQQASFLFPSILLVCRRRNETVLPKNRAFALPSAMGWAVNLFAIAFMAVTTIVFMLPAQLPATASNMNYTVVILVLAALFTIVNWFVHGRTHYQGPRIHIRSIEGGTQ